MAHKYTCPNCSQPFTKLADHPESGCVLQALFGVASDRGEVADDLLAARLATCDVDGLWNVLGPIVDDLERGEHSVE